MLQVNRISARVKELSFLLVLFSLCRIEKRLQVQEKKNLWTGLHLVFLLKTRFQLLGVVGKL